MKVLVVKPGEIPVVRDLTDIDAIKSEIGITKSEDWETHLLNDGQAPYENMGVVARDQDKRFKKNVLGLKGAFVICGYTRTDIGNKRIHEFDGLTEEQINNARKQLVRQAIFSR